MRGRRQGPRRRRSGSRRSRLSKGACRSEGRIPGWLWDGGRWGRGSLAEIETVRHVVRGGVAWVQRAEAEGRLAEFQHADMRMQDLGDVPIFGIRAQHKASD